MYTSHRSAAVEKHLRHGSYQSQSSCRKDETGAGDVSGGRRPDQYRSLQGGMHGFDVVGKTSKQNPMRSRIQRQNEKALPDHE